MSTDVSITRITSDPILIKNGQTCFDASIDADLNFAMYCAKDTAGEVLKLLAKNKAAQVNELHLNATNSPTRKAGTLHYNSNKETVVALGALATDDIMLGNEIKVPIYNYDGATLVKGDVVYIYGGVYSNNAIKYAVKKACADSIEKSSNLLIVQSATILDTAYGFATKIGLVDDVNFPDLTVGKTLYLSATTNGAITDVQPQYPNLSVKIGRSMLQTVGSSESAWFVSAIYFEPDADPQYSITGTSNFPPSLTLVNTDNILSTYGLLYKAAVDDYSSSKPSVRYNQDTQFDNSDCDPSVLGGGRIRQVNVACSALAVAGATTLSPCYVRVSIFKIQTSTEGGIVLIQDIDVAMNPNSVVNIYNNLGTPDGARGSTLVDIAVTAGDLIGVMIKMAATFSGGNDYINAMRNTVVGLSIY